MQFGYTYGNRMLLDSTYRSSRISQPKPLKVSMLRRGAQNAASISKNLLSKFPSWETTRTVAKNFGRAGLVGAGIGTAAGIAAFGIVSAISSKAQSLRRPPVVHTSRIRNTGQTNQYYNLGADPFAGVRFAGRKRNFML